MTKRALTLGLALTLTAFGLGCDSDTDSLLDGVGDAIGGAADAIGGGGGGDTTPGTDTAGPTCGDGVCDTGEDEASCPADCSSTSVCGDGTCDADESEATCPQDCQSGPVCGDGTCDPTENASTCPQDCSSASQLYCFEMLPCLNDCASAPGANPQACLGECQAQGYPGEGVLFTSFFQCLAGCANQQTGELDFTCVSSTCLGATADCYAGGTYGAGDCFGINTCIQGCGQANVDCQRTCYEAGTKEAVEANFAIEFCISEECANPQTGALDQACAQAALQDGGACFVEAYTCQFGEAPPVCGDGVCDEGETAETCADDCATAPPTLCETYCDLAGTNCVDGDALSFDVDCATSCAAFADTGDDGDVDGDTVQCRITHLTLAADDPALHCPHGAVDGGGVCVAAELSPCEEYCALAADTCTGDNAIDFSSFEGGCAEACEGYATDGGDGDFSGDTIQCRITHLTLATDDPATHCPHGGVDGGGVCVDTE